MVGGLPLITLVPKSWYGPEEQLNYVRLIDIPYTLAYEIVGHRKDIPRYGCKIVGDVIHYDIDCKPFVGDDLYQDDDSEDDDGPSPFDSSEHFAKLPTYNEEIDR